MKYSKRDGDVLTVTFDTPGIALHMTWSLRMSVYIEKETDIRLEVSDISGVVTSVVEAALASVGCPFEAEVNVTIAGGDEVHRINREFRGIDKTTDVLSFPAIEFEAPGDFSSINEEDDFCAEFFNPDTGELMLGDMIISADKVKEQAAEYGHTELRELGFLVAHSMFHLFGYDHEEPEEARIMEEKQEAVLEGLGIKR